MTDTPTEASDLDMTPLLAACGAAIEVAPDKKMIVEVLEAFFIFLDGDREKALTKLSPGLEAEDPQAYHLAAIIEEDRRKRLECQPDDYEEVLEAFKQARELAPSDVFAAQCLERMAQCFYRKREYERAEVVYAEAATLFEDQASSESEFR